MLNRITVQELGKELGVKGDDKIIRRLLRDEFPDEGGHRKGE